MEERWECVVERPDCWYYKGSFVGCYSGFAGIMEMVFRRESLEMGVDSSLTRAGDGYGFSWCLTELSCYGEDQVMDF